MLAHAQRIRQVKVLPVRKRTVDNVESNRQTRHKPRPAVHPVGANAPCAIEQTHEGSRAPDGDQCEIDPVGAHGAPRLEMNSCSLGHIPAVRLKTSRGGAELTGTYILLVQPRPTYFQTFFAAAGGLAGIAAGVTGNAALWLFGGPVLRFGGLVLLAGVFSHTP